MDRAGMVHREDMEGNRDGVGMARNVAGRVGVGGKKAVGLHAAGNSDRASGGYHGSVCAACIREHGSSCPCHPDIGRLGEPESIHCQS